MTDEKNKAIGIFDSGLGGLTCVAEIRRLMPNENIVYFGDTARIPYGTRSKETVLEYAKQDVAFIKKHDVKMIIAACGTVSSIVGGISGFAGDIPFTGVVVPAVQTACAVTQSNKIGVIGTSATIRSGAYCKAIRSIRSDIKIAGNSCPLFVQLVENGLTSPDDPVVRIMVERYLTPIKNENVDTLILGCTHYPMLHAAISEFMGSGVKLISSGAEAAKHTMKTLAGKRLLSNRTEPGTAVYYTSDSAAMFEENAHAFLGGELHGSVEKISIDELVL